MSRNKGMLILISDLHLTDQLKGGQVPREALFERFWVRIDAARRGAPARLVFNGDLFDIVRSPRWLSSDLRPYHDPDDSIVTTVEAIVDDIAGREQAFLAAIRRRVEAGELEVDYILGNHDRLLASAPRARRKIRHALTGRDEPIEFPTEQVYAEHAVVAFHGNRTDFICSSPEGQAPIGDAIGSDLIVRFPREIRERTGAPLPELDDIDDVRPIFAVPAWVRHFGASQKGLMRTVAMTWKQIVDDFFDNPFTRDWMREHRRGGLSEARKLQLLLQLSTGRIMRRTGDHRLASLYRFFQQFFDGRFATKAAEMLESEAYRGLRYVVNGHSHFASMVPLGQLDGRPAAYFNTGTWRTVHQMGRLLTGRPAFLPYEAMSYLVFFPDGDEMGRDYEWWTGAMVTRDSDVRTESA